MELNGIRPASELTATAAGRDATSELGKNEFLELMIAQINNQDPLDPAKNEDFVAQLAQFSSLEGIQNLNSSMEGIADAFGSSLTLQAAALVGRSVLVPTPRAFMDGQGLTGNVLNSTGDREVVVEITDSGGALTRRLSLGIAPEGDLRFRWDGANEAGEPQPPGSYGVRAYAIGADDTAELEVELPEVVVSVSLQNGRADVNLVGGASVPLSDVREIQ